MTLNRQDRCLIGLSPCGVLHTGAEGLDEAASMRLGLKDVAWPRVELAIARGPNPFLVITSSVCFLPPGYGSVLCTLVPKVWDQH